MTPKPLKIYIHAMDGTGHLNACVGFAQSLEKRGHKCVFLLNAAFKGQFAKFGFEEIHLERAKSDKPGGDDKSEEKVNPVKAFAKMILNSGMLSAKSSLEKLKESAENGDGDDTFARMLYESTKDFNPQIEKAIKMGNPDLFILDHFMVPPAVAKLTIPWLYLFSGNPLGILNSLDLPPFTSGYPCKGDRKLWEEFRSYKNNFRENFIKFQKQLYEDFNHEAGPDDYPEEGMVFPNCKHGYIYGYPEELDYSDEITIPEKYIQVDAFCRETPEPFQFPEQFNQLPGEKIIYFSLGSMGSADVNLVKKVCAVLEKTKYKCVVSKGPLADEYDLPSNCWGEGYLPQTRILPLVDLVITHGGNNTITETFSFGRPMIVLPLFGDQHDNAMRIQEKGYGIKVNPYNFEEQEMLDAIEKLIHDDALKARLAVAAKRIENSNSKERACAQIEALVEKYRG